MLTTADRKALAMLRGGQEMLDLARDVSNALAAMGLEGGIVGGIAVFLHGYRRTTVDIDAFCYDRKRLAEGLERRGWVWSVERRQFEKGGVPLHILAPQDDIGFDPTRFQEIEGIRVVSLGDLMSMKLASGSRNVNRAKDLADVVELIKACKLDKNFTGRVDKAYRPEFKQLVDSVDLRDEPHGGRD